MLCEPGTLSPGRLERWKPSLIVGGRQHKNGARPDLSPRPPAPSGGAGGGRPVAQWTGDAYRDGGRDITDEIQRESIQITAKHYVNDDTVNLCYE